MEWFATPSRRLIMKLSLSVQLTDDLTGLPIKGSNARVWIDDRKPPIKKDGGRYIFTDLEPGEYILKAEGGTYTYTETACTVSEDELKSVTIRLIPNRSYPLPSDAVHIEGKAEPGAVIRMYSDDRHSAFKLLYDAKKGSDVIGIYHTSNVNLLGKLLKILSSDGTGEYIKISSYENKEKSEYKLSKGLDNDYMKLGTAIIPASECVSDDKGRFLLLIKNTKSEPQLVCDITSNGKTVQKTVGLTNSKYISLDLTE